MSNYTKELNELYECYNLISHIGKRLNLENSNPTEASSVVIHSRSVYTLRNKITELTSSRPSLTVNFQLGLAGLQNLVHFIAVVCKKFSEESTEILSSKQREALSSYYSQVKDGVLYCSGYLSFLLESKESVETATSFYADKKEFIELAQNTYALITEQEERNTTVSAEGENIRPIMSSKEAVESQLDAKYGDDDIVLGTSPSVSSNPLE